MWCQGFAMKISVKAKKRTQRVKNPSNVKQDREGTHTQATIWEW